MSINNSNHPFWKWAFHATYLFAAYAGMKMWATDFNETEAKSWITMVGIVCASGGVKKFVTRDGRVRETEQS